MDEKSLYQYRAKLDRVVDGDTIDIIIDLGFKMTTNQRIRLARIDTPEVYRVKAGSAEYASGQLAKSHVEKRMHENNGEFVIYTSKYTGKYGRYIGEIFFEDSDISLNDDLVLKGLAKYVV